MEAEGFEVFHTTDATEIIARLPQVIEQWNERRAVRLDGGTVFDHDVLAALSDVATELAGMGRFWFSGIERSGQLVASGLVVTAGPVATFWVSGFDAAWSRISPGTLMIDIVIAFAAERGYEELDLGVGDQPYKYRITDQVDQLDMIDFERRERRPLHSLMRLMTYDQRSALKSQLQRRLRPAAPSVAFPTDHDASPSSSPTVTG
jgi:CelD/BcsL family acetyltransferase involved in cellulose biosynthesis